MMNPISINSGKFLGEYIDANNRARFPEGLLFTGLLLSATMLTLFCVVGGISTLFGIVCVIILGSALGLLLALSGDYTVRSASPAASLC